MKAQTMLAAVVSGVLVTLGMATPAGAMSIAPDTQANLLNAMHGEATAFAKYTAFAEEADRTGHASVATLLRSTADQERNEHFAEEAEFVELVGDQSDNLRTAIRAELYEATYLYRRYARQANADHDEAATDLFRELAADESMHRRLLQRALRALDHGRACPEPPTIDSVTIVAGPATSHGRTLENIKAAMLGEAFASARYRMYAEAAANQGDSAAAELLMSLSEFERLEHFAALANLAGLVGDTSANLTEAIFGENYETTVMYPSYAAAAVAAGDTAVGGLLTEIGGDEARHRDAFAAALAEL